MNPRRAAPSPGGSFCFRPSGPSWDLPFLRRLAERLSTFPAGFAVLIESLDGGDPLVTPGTAELVNAVRGASTGLPGSLDRLRRSEALPSGGLRPGRFVALCPGDPIDPRPDDSDRGRAPESNGSVDRRRAWLPDESDLAEPAELGGPRVQWHWFSTGGDRLAVRIRAWVPVLDALDGPLVASAAARIRERLPVGGPAVRFVSLPVSWRRRRAWATGSLNGFYRGRPFRLSPTEASRAVRPSRPMATLDDPTLARHVVAIGASGSGKSSFLAHLARDRIARGRATVVLDVHGDLGPAISAGLDDAARARLTAVDATRPVEEIPGVALFASDRADHREREAAHLVASLRHLSHDGSEVYWGHRLEHVFDVFVRLVEEERGGFSDLYELLSDPSRRDAARAATRRPAAARFLDELPALLRRNPEYLQPALARVQKVALDPRLARLLDATDRPVNVAEILESGGSVIFRIPSAELGPSASRFAATLLTSRTYLATAATRGHRGELRVLAILDGAHTISPSLLAEILSEGRKFGFAVAIATQYAARLSPEALAAAEGAAGSHLVFHAPRSAAAPAGRWAGLDRLDAERILPALPPGVALADLALSAGPRGLLHVPPIVEDGGRAWEIDCQRAAKEYGGRGASEPAITGWGSPDEAILLGIFGLESQPRSPTVADALEAAQRIVPGFDPVELASRIPSLTQRGWIDRDDRSLRLTVAGARRLGIGAPSGATRESAEHRGLLIEALRIFASRGEWLEVVRQGRFDTRLPDGLVRLLPPGTAQRTPEELLGLVTARSNRWVWRAFGGRNVHVEAEVSGAERPERILRGLQKARTADASVVFLVGDARRARRVRAVLRRESTSPREAQVWTLPRARSMARNLKGPPTPSPAPEAIDPS